MRLNLFRASFFIETLTPDSSLDVLYCVAFPAKYAIGDWTALGEPSSISLPPRESTTDLYLDDTVNSRDRTENVPAHSSRNDLLSGDDVFPPSYFEQRLKMVDALCDAMERVGAVWPIGHKASLRKGILTVLDFDPKLTNSTRKIVCNDGIRRSYPTR